MSTTSEMKIGALAPWFGADKADLGTLPSDVAQARRELEEEYQQEEESNGR
jgi:hypothetical protein